MNTFILNGHIQSIAESVHPLQSTIEFVLTDFEPNENAEAIDITEAENIISSVISMPIKANFIKGSIEGHAQALPIGTITHAELRNDPKPHIFARAVLWKKEHEDLDTFLRTKMDNGEQIGTSWEVYYKQAEQKNGIKWLKDIIMAATTIVKKPAYGTRTPILAIAELYSLANVDEPEEITPESISTLAKTLGKTMEESKSELETLKTSLAELEAKIKELKDAETAHLAEIEKMRTEKAQAEADQTFKERSEKLNVFGIEKSRDVLLSMSNELFAEYLKDMEAVSAKKSVAEKVKVPNTLGNTSETSKAKQIAEAMKKRSK